MLSQFLSGFIGGIVVFGGLAIATDAAYSASFCTSSMDKQGKASEPECRIVLELPPNTGEVPQEFIIPEADRK